MNVLLLALAKYGILLATDVLVPEIMQWVRRYADEHAGTVPTDADVIAGFAAHVNAAIAEGEGFLARTEMSK